MPEFLRSAFYPVLLVCLVGGLWMLGRATADRDYLPPEFSQPTPAYQKLMSELSAPAKSPTPDALASTEEDSE